MELYKGDERFAKIEDGDTLFANNPFYEQAKEDIELLTEAGNEFSEEAILAGELTPVFFGSALTNFGGSNLPRYLPQICARTTWPQDSRWR